MSTYSHKSSVLLNALRKYDIPDIQIGDWKGQYGLEETPALYIDHTKLWAKEAWRVLRDDGVMFLNIADSYGTKSGSMGKGKWKDPKLSDEQNNAMPEKPDLNMHKCQLLIPHRVAIALVEDGWTLRNTIIWYKPNAMPESVTDRFSKKYEYVFMLSKSDKYYFDLDAVREPHKTNENRPMGIVGDRIFGYDSKLKEIRGHKTKGDKDILRNPQRHGNDINYFKKGKNPGDVWQIPTQPSSEKHYAMWPQRLVERMIKCSTKAGDTILDPFAGSGTTLKVAKELQRKAIGIDLGYQDIQERKLCKIQKKMFV